MHSKKPNKFLKIHIKVVVLHKEALFYFYDRSLNINGKYFCKYL